MRVQPARKVTGWLELPAIVPLCRRHSRAKLRGLGQSSRVPTRKPDEPSLSHFFGLIRVLRRYSAQSGRGMAVRRGSAPAPPEFYRLSAAGRMEGGSFHPAESCPAITP